jgi:hypothetical protein
VSSPVSASQAVRDASVAILNQLADTLESFSDEQYTTPGPAGAAMGGHVRHTLDHYRKLADGHANADTVAYDRRERGGSIETDRGAAVAEARELARTFEGLDETRMGSPVRICAMVTGDGCEAELDSTFVRELWFASHHAIHHAALMKPIAAAAGIELPAEFGRAPSTVNHESGSN